MAEVRLRPPALHAPWDGSGRGMLMMKYTTRPGATSYGHDIGILMLDCHTPFIPGDVGNASSFGFPVLYHTMPGVTLDRLINQADTSMADTVVGAAKALEAQGVAAITSDCGYMLLFQQTVAAQVRVPVLLSSLLQLPMVASMMGPGQAVGIICANRQRLPWELVAPLHAMANCEIHVVGLEHCPHFRGPILDETDTLDAQAIEQEVVRAVTTALAEHPDIGAWLFECSNLPPYAHAVQVRTGKPVFDYVTMINFMRSGVRRAPFAGHY